MFQKVLVAFDGSAGAWCALRRGAALAWRHGATLTIATVVPTSRPDVKMGTTEPLGRALCEALAAAAEYVRGYGLAQEIVLRHGHAAREIIELAREGDFDLLVVGHAGHSRIWEHFLGTTADKISRHAPCSVLIVR